MNKLPKKEIPTIPLDLDGMNLVSANAGVYTASTSGTPTIQIRNVTDSQDMLSTRITIDGNGRTYSELDEAVSFIPQIFIT